MTDIPINAEFHGPISHPYNITRAIRYVDYTRQVLLDLKPKLKKGINISDFLNKHLSDELIINDINSDNLKFDLVV